VVTIGSIHGGQAFNVIPEKVTMLGTIRTFDRDLRRSMRARITRIVSGVAAGLGCRAQVELEEGSDAVINDPEIAELARRAAAAVVGERNVVVPDATMGGEDVSEYLSRAPGCFVFIGSANPAKGLAEPHHSPRFDFDEAALPIGCEFLVRAATAAMA
jgi:amidohydrolase